MLDKNMSKSEIEKELRGKGDFVQIDYLTKFLDKMPPIAIKKFALMKLIEIYENKKMFNDVGKTYELLAINAISSPEKIECFIKEAEYYIKAGSFERADSAMRRAMEISNIVKKAEIYSKVKEIYIRQGEIFENEAKRNSAIKVYEKLLVMKISEAEKEEIKKKLLALYEQLGKFREFSNLNHRRV